MCSFLYHENPFRNEWCGDPYNTSRKKETNEQTNKQNLKQQKKKKKKKHLCDKSREIINIGLLKFLLMLTLKNCRFLTGNRKIYYTYHILM